MKIIQEIIDYFNSSEYKEEQERIDEARQEHYQQLIAKIEANDPTIIERYFNALKKNPHVSR